jgi:hypothetical protein
VKRRFTEALRQAMRRRRLEGAKLEEIRAEFGVSLNGCWRTVHDIPVPREGPPPFGPAVVREACARHGITEEQFHPARGAVSRAVHEARWTAILALRALGFDDSAIVEVFDRPGRRRRSPCEVAAKAEQAARIPTLVFAAREIAAKVSAPAEEGRQAA